MTLSKAEIAKRAVIRRAGKEAPSEQPPASPAVRSSVEIPDTGTVTVACKMPTGLILRLFAPSVEYENVLGGGQRKVEIMRPVGEQVRVWGYAVPVNKRPKFTITGTDFALTEGVDAKFFKTWMEQNKDLPAVKAGLIFCAAKKVEADAKAEDMGHVRNGLEPMAIKNDPRAGKSPNPNLESISPADRTAAARTV